MEKILRSCKVASETRVGHLNKLCLVLLEYSECLPASGWSIDELARLRVTEGKSGGNLKGISRG